MGQSCIPRVGAGFLLIDELNRVLLTLRNLPPGAGSWSFVGGKLDFLEAHEECAAREARAEVGIEVSIQSLLCVTDHCLPQKNQHWVSPAYLARVRTGKAINCEPEKNRRCPVVRPRLLAPESDHDGAKRNSRPHPATPFRGLRPAAMML